MSNTDEKARAILSDDELHDLTVTATRDADFGTRLKACLQLTEGYESLRSLVAAKTEECAAVKASYQEIIDYVMGYFPVGMCYINPIQAMNVVIDRMKAAEQSLSRAREETREACAVRCDKEAAAYKQSRTLCENSLNLAGASADLHGEIACELCANSVRALALPGHETAPSTTPGREGDTNA